jgi:hypothetical protein
MPIYGSYTYLEEKAKEEKKHPENSDHWLYNVADQLSSEVETIINQKGQQHGLESNIAQG